jgi:hypothetical protein
MSLQILTLVCGYLVCFLVGVLGLLILWQIYVGNIDLSRLISEPTGDASMSRFQFLVFTFVIALSLFLVIVASNPPSFPMIPGTVLTLLGISGSSYLVSKGIQFSDPAGVADRTGNAVITITPTKAMVRYEQTQQFKAEVPGKPGAKLKWQVIAGAGTIDGNGLYTAPKRPSPPGDSATANGDAAPASAPPLAYATIQVTPEDFPDAHDLAVVTLS